jgi:hypothetical protein
LQRHLESVKRGSKRAEKRVEVIWLLNARFLGEGNERRRGVGEAAVAGLCEEDGGGEVDSVQTLARFVP